MTDRPIICVPDAIPPDQREHYDAIRQYIAVELQSSAPLVNGYALHFDDSAETIMRLAEFITLERLCCPFLDFALLLTQGQVTLHLTGDEGVKDFLKQELSL